MRKWGIVVSVFYAVIVLGLLAPAGLILAGDTDPLKAVFWQYLLSMFEAQLSWLVWTPIAAVVAGQAALLFLSVDTSFKKLKPRTHVAVSVTVTSMLFGLLTFAAIFSLDAAIRGGNSGSDYLDAPVNIIGLLDSLMAALGDSLRPLFQKLQRIRHASHFMAAQRQRAGASDCGPKPHRCPSPRRLFCSGRDQLRHCYGDCRDAPVFWSKRFAPL